MKKLFNFIVFIYSLFLVNYQASAKQIKEYKIIIKDHKFEPRNLEITSDQKVMLIIENQDKTAEEFESYDLNREKIIAGGSSVKIYIGPLKVGIYKYFGEFNKKTAQGTIVVTSIIDD